jgi:predicted TIM-barrel fold metal-dependent hydrolase
MKNGTKIIDFRVRPPVAAYSKLFDLHLALNAFENKFYSEPAIAVSPSMHKVGEEAGLDLLMKEIDEAGIDFVVAPGRATPAGGMVFKAMGDDVIDFNVSDEALVGLRKRFNNRLFGLTALELGKPADELVAQIRKAITQDGLSGVVMEPGYYKEPNGEQLWADNKRLYPVYETIVELDVFVMHQSGIFAGTDFGVNHWPPVDRLLQDFPNLKFLLAHGGYPDVLPALALAAKHRNYYISPDVYCFFPGGELYINAITKLQDQFIFASAYPLAGQKESVDGALQFPLSKGVMSKFMYGNAARLLKIN